MFYIFTLHSKSDEFSDCIDYIKSKDILEPFNLHHSYKIKQNEQMCFTGNFIFSSDKKFKAKTKLFLDSGYNGEEKKIDWIENPVAVAGGCYLKDGISICRNASTVVMCLEDVCDFTVYKIEYRPNNVSFKGTLNGVSGYDTRTIDMVTIATKETGTMQLYRYNDLKLFKNGHFEGTAFRHYGIIVQNGKPKIEAKNTSKATSYRLTEDGNSYYFTINSRKNDIYLQVDYMKGEDTAETKKLHFQECQITLNPEGDLYTKDSSSFQFTTFKEPLDTAIIVLIVILILAILGTVGGILCCVCLPCCCCYACCIKCMPCCARSENKESAAAEV
ncbi:hypothetical protein TVAG_378840 [Trichomonas vaginalis G3]|uniref:Uncharacterized protein n=1 Tax=Trichomonas vaginalis (strain ATCC PRA-98 / G3) TaxID=412133 RepID=A2DB75_TRIV3|nr:hypothetical protein TVAGG3_0509130 [Trichomonas vaginalis G3]EAY22405.1 hypothetical protein TVAG_378840 [Trichomonas vaginalis G3]KAI5517651.1 hypothetical protein TVAGG3_0509130 [Trichomonas vaginalis G3]|eukprot:XP_001583391.1 hypothetical protein [Trichomonas vaginalis G3]